MAYKIAVASSDGVKIDLKFGQINEFLIYEVSDGDYKLLEKREFKPSKGEAKESYSLGGNCGSGEGLKNCKTGAGSCSGGGKACSGPADILDKISLISDCKALVCKKVGFQAMKQLEKKAISVFDVDFTIDYALSKIVSYYG
ncbi:MAG: hypothetical protein K6F41_05480 [Lachnospira sp.]|nr:hypothetical protein [Lachnospira sp.]